MKAVVGHQQHVGVELGIAHRGRVATAHRIVRLRELAGQTDARAKQLADQLRRERDRLAPEIDALGERARGGWSELQDDVTRGLDDLERKLDAALGTP
jgi:hypothetical protein